MDGVHPHFTVRTSFGFLLLVLLLLQPSVEDQSVCSGPTDVQIPENTEVNKTVATITAKEGVTLEFAPASAKPDNPFELVGNELKIKKPLDFETTTNYGVQIICTDPSGRPAIHVIVVIVTNVNEDPPVFNRSSYHFSVNEMSPVNEYLGTIFAEDPDRDALYYTLTPESSGFKLESTTNASIFTERSFNYDEVQNVQLVLKVQDRQFTSDNDPSFTSSTNIMVTIIDVDNRPPWFQPCTNYTVSGVLICQTSGYTGTVLLNEENGVIPLQPGPIHAIDGDFGINEEITYSFLTGKKSGAFEIDEISGNITVWNTTMLNIMDKTISLTVVAAQKNNSYQFATTSVTITLQEKSQYPPEFEKSEYEGVVTAVGNMVMDKNMDKPLRITATDKDYTDGNPNINYSINSTDFVIINGYLFMINNLPGGRLYLQVEAIDESNGDNDTAKLLVDVQLDVPTTTVVTTNSVATPPTGESTTDSKTTKDTGGSGSTGSTAQPHTGLTTILGTTNNVATPPTGDSTTDSKTTKDTGGSGSTGSTAQPHTGLTTTTVGTTNSVATPPTGDSTTDSKTTKDTGGSGSTGSTAQPHTGVPTTTVGTTNSVATPPTGDSTTNSKTTKDTGGSGSTGSTAQPHTGVPTTILGTTNNVATPPTGESTTNSKTTKDTGGSGSTGSTAQPHTGLTTTTTVGTTTSMAMTSMGDSTTNSKTTKDIMCTTSTAIPSTTNGNIILTTMPSGGCVTTPNPTLTTEGSVSAASTVQPHTGVPTTILGTTNSVATPPTGESTTNSKTTKDTGGSGSTGSTAQPHTGLTTEGCVCTLSTTQPDTDCYGPEDMAALGVTLGILLLICVVAIVILACDFRRGKADWKKIYETNIFRSSLGQGSDGQKAGIQYTNDAFQKDEDEDGDSTQQTGQTVVAFEEPQKAVQDIPVYEAILKSSAPLHALLRDDISQSGSDRSDSEKDVKPILTKERRMDDGYKSVWFKEDIDPDAKEEVVIIPGSQESDSEEEEEEDEEQIKRVAFNDGDLDSGLELKVDDGVENSSC